eukprot:scaffold6068_cov119-Isochrysis_galbana.AAC.7
MGCNKARAWRARTRRVLSHQVALLPHVGVEFNHTYPRGRRHVVFSSFSRRPCQQQGPESDEAGLHRACQWRTQHRLHVQYTAHRSARRTR